MQPTDHVVNNASVSESREDKEKIKFNVRALDFSSSAVYISFINLYFVSYVLQTLNMFSDLNSTCICGSTVFFVYDANYVFINKNRSY